MLYLYFIYLFGDWILTRRTYVCVGDGALTVYCSEAGSPAASLAAVF